MENKTDKEYRYRGLTDIEHVYPGSKIKVNPIELYRPYLHPETAVCLSEEWQENDIVTKDNQEYLWNGEEWELLNPGEPVEYAAVVKSAGQYAERLQDIGVEPTWETVKMAYLTGAGFL